jgi:hypothetical protein
MHTDTARSNAYKRDIGSYLNLLALQRLKNIKIEGQHPLRIPGLTSIRKAFKINEAAISLES